MPRAELTIEVPDAVWIGAVSREHPATRVRILSAFGDGSGPADDEPDIIETFAIVTAAPNAVVGDLPHRMAVILSPGEEHRWLSADPGDARDLLVPHPGEEMDAYPVSRAVNDPANDSPAVLDPLDGGSA